MKCAATNRTTSRTRLRDIAVNVKRSSKYESQEGGFVATQNFVVSFTAPARKTPIIEISATFDLTYTSKTPLTDELFQVFSEINLPVNVWPYLRELTGSMTSRMDLPPFVLPLLKR